MQQDTNPPEFKSKSDLIADYIAYKTAWQISDNREDTEIRMTAEELAGAYLQLYGDGALRYWNETVVPLLYLQEDKTIDAVRQLLAAALDPKNY